MELVRFLKQYDNDIIREASLGALFGLTADPEGIGYLLENKPILSALIEASHSEPKENLQKVALSSLINISAEEKGALALNNIDSLYKIIFESIISKKPCLSLFCQLATNLSHYPIVCSTLIKFLETKKDLLNALTHVLGKVDVISTHPDLESLATFFCNLTKEQDGRRLFLQEENEFLDQVLPLLLKQPIKSTTLKFGLVGTIRNCCFETEAIPTLIKADVAKYLLFPLIGPEPLRESEMESLPLEIQQFLGPSKKRELSAEIRKMLIESLIQLCAVPSGRKYLRDIHAYFILRELHRWEEDRPTIIAINNLVTILIGEEPAPGMENLKNVTIPSEIEKQFQEWDLEDTQPGSS